MKREKYRLTTEDFIKRAREVHGEKYDYSKTIYINKRTNVIITCPIHGDFSQNPHNHITQHQGCPVCGVLKAKERKGDYKNSRKTKEEFQRDLEKIYGKKYEVIGDYVNNKTKIKIYCHAKNKDGQEHGVFEVKPNDIICGHGCRRCVHSLMEDDFELFLINNNIQYEHSKNFRDWLGRQHLDFYLPEYNIAIECQGSQHFVPVDFPGRGPEWAQKNFERTKKLDNQKKDLCEQHDIKILYLTDKEEHILNEDYFIDKEKLIKKIKDGTSKEQE